jgi:hypothetical protein
MTGNVAGKFITPLRAHFADPSVADTKLFYLHIAADLAEFNDAELTEAATQIRRSSDGKRFPTLSECLDACREAKTTLALRKAAAARKSSVKPKMSAEEERLRKKFADEQLRQPIAQTAADEGWIIGFHDFCEDEGRLPNLQEIRKIQAERKQLLSNLNNAAKETNYSGIISRTILKAITGREKMLKEKVSHPKAA